jgi:hypothetical protein
MCFGGSAPAAPAPSPPPPQLAQTPAVSAIRSDTAAGISAATGGTLLSGAMGDASPAPANLGRHSLLGQ